MNHYTYTQTLGKIWEDAVRQYREGKRGPESLFNEDQIAFLASIGLGVMDVYDYAEDHVSSDNNEPDFATFIAVHDIRRAYFLEVQKGNRSEHVIDMDKLPAKDEAVAGIPWLPRILPKARAKLRGEAPRDLMYGCGGDRRFFRENNIHPAEFLRLVWEVGDDDAAIINWVKARRESVPQPVEA